MDAYNRRARRAPVVSRGIHMAIGTGKGLQLASAAGLRILHSAVLLAALVVAWLSYEENAISQDTRDEATRKPTGLAQAPAARQHALRIRLSRSCRPADHSHRARFAWPLLHGRIVDFWTNAFAYVGGVETGYRGGTFALVGPGWNGRLPPSVTRINSPTRWILIQPRVHVASQDDLPAAKAVLDAITAEGLAEAAGEKAPAKPQFVDVIAGKKTVYKSISLSDATITIAGSNAIARNVFSTEFESDGKPGTAKIGELQVWAKQDGSWKLLARQGFRTPT